MDPLSGSSFERTAASAFLPLLLAATGLTLWVGADSAWMNPFSDSVEYTMAAMRLATLGSYDVVIGASAHPPRYPPGFSALFIAPIHWLGSQLGLAHYGAGIHPVFGSSLIIVACCWLLCRRTLTGWSGVAAACCTAAVLVRVTPFRIVAAQIMTDVPTLMMFFCGLVLLQRRWRQPTSRTFLTAGLLTAVALSVRPTSISLCFPFVALLVLRRSQTSRRDVLALFVPIAISVAGLLLYQQRTFGDALFTGYHYWLIPAHYQLGWEHFGANLARVPHPFLPIDGPTSLWHRLVAPFVVAIVAALGFECRRQDRRLFRSTTPIIVWIAFAALPIFVLHLFHPFHMARFALVLHATVTLLGWIWFFSLFGSAASPPAERNRTIAITVSVLAIWSVLDARLETPTLSGGQPLEILRSAQDHLSEDAVFVSDQNGMFVHAMLIDGTRRSHVPATAAAPFVSWSNIGFPDSKPARVLGTPASADPRRIEAALTSGRRVFVEVPAVPTPEHAWTRLRQRFRLKPVWRGHPRGAWIAEISTGALSQAPRSVR